MADNTTLTNLLAGIPEDPWADQPLVTTQNALAYRDKYADEVEGLQRLYDSQDPNRKPTDEEAYGAMARLAMAAIPGLAAVRGALLPEHLGEAVRRHIAQQRKVGNPMVNAATTPFLKPYLTASTPLARPAIQRWDDFGERGLSWWMRPLVPGSKPSHTEDAVRMLNHLDRVEPKAKTIY
jgi:hypothetical protein